MKIFMLVLIVCVSFTLVGCKENSVLESLTESATLETAEACIACVQGVQAQANGQSKMKEIYDKVEGIELPAEE